ncbi:DUF1501 domain-containing protein [Stigmatella aurantiaca]|uniref:Conserved uncharacterized protein n=1 Tax=Stigmatella aurantiaca (strain DW4/3-1) TaxID=378806 RepID=Q08N55_STIAD|nr:DUF1501 domain-containing protein [Stigmatella aurantiaca]ADO75091.1 conserved uncharacterized protein [Stigmatella aurantiaca DW4/3-1]EAU61918.1 conserved hypothetical protein [Stigmatella aurantiaca DW4/3-1]
MTLSRRHFLRDVTRGLGCLATASVLPRWLGEAEAASISGYAGYRAAVCVFLLGGNDSNNLLIPKLSAPYAQYKAARPNIGIANADLLTINPVGLAAASYGLHPSLVKLQALFEQERAAVVCNVGPLVLPMKKDDYLTGAVARPDNLFSHADQQDAWASSIANPSSVSLPLALVGKVTGWGGRTADKIAGLNPGEYPDVTSFGGKAIFATGASRQPMMVSSSGTLGFRTSSDTGFNALYQESLSEVLGIHNDVTLQASYGGTFATAQNFATARTAAREAAWLLLPQATRDAIDALFVLPEGGSSWGLPGQLYQVIRDLVAGATPTASGGLGLKRQVFSVGLGGFDTHTGQDTAQSSLFKQLDFALNAFHQALTLLRAGTNFGATPPQTTLFTISDFGRTFVENSDKGTDHGWGSHMIVLGDRVVGRRLYGAFPNLDLTSNAANNLDTVDSKGRWIPSLTVDQYAYSVASWLGLSTTAERDYVFPNLGAYVAAATANGFPAYAKTSKIGFLLADA